MRADEVLNEPAFELLEKARHEPEGVRRTLARKLE